MSNLTTFLDRLDKKTAEICELNALIKQREDKHSAFQSVVFNAFSGPPKKGESSEDYVRRIAADKANLELRRRELVGIVTAIDELPLPKADDESYEQYVLRLGDYLRAITSALKSLGPCDGETVADSIYRVRRERNDAERKVGELSLSHSLAMEKAAAEIEKLGKRDAELLALYDVVESFPAFPMQPAETYSEYLRRLQARLVTLTSDLARLVAQIETGNGEYAAERAKNQLLTEKHTDLHAANDALRKQRDAWMDGRYLVHFEPGLHGLHWAVVDKGVVTDFSPVVAGANMHGISAPRPEIGLWFTRVVHQPQPGQREMVEVEMPIIIRAIENADAAKSAVDMQAECSKIAAEREHFRAKWDASLKSRDSAQDEARRTRETNEALQGHLTLRSQIIARVMMDPATDKLFNERDWSDAARKVLIEARGLCGENGTATA